MALVLTFSQASYVEYKLLKVEMGCPTFAYIKFREKLGSGRLSQVWEGEEQNRKPVRKNGGVGKKRGICLHINKLGQD
jgi:hypothetical protein